MEVNPSHRILKIKSHWILSIEYLYIDVTYLNFLPLNWTLSIFLYFSMFTNSKSNVQRKKIKLQYFQHLQIQHAKLSCKIQCMKFSVNIRGHRQEQSSIYGQQRKLCLLKKLLRKSLPSFLDVLHCCSLFIVSHSSYPWIY